MQLEREMEIINKGMRRNHKNEIDFIYPKIPPSKPFPAISNLHRFRANTLLSFPVVFDGSYRLSLKVRWEQLNRCEYTWFLKAKIRERCSTTFSNCQSWDDDVQTINTSWHMREHV